MKKFLQTGAVFVFVVLLAGQALAESIGHVTAVIPGAYAVRGGQDVPLTVKSAIESGDSLRTDASGKVQIIFADNTTVTLGNNTVMDMQEFAMNEGDSAFKAHLGQGIMRTITGAIVEQNPKGFSVTTPEATIGIRGTIWTGMSRNGFTTVWLENSLKQLVVNDTEVFSGQKITVPATPRVTQSITPEDIEFILEETTILMPRASRDRQIVEVGTLNAPPKGLASIPLTTQTAGDHLNGGYVPPPPPVTTAIISGTLSGSFGAFPVFTAITNSNYRMTVNLSNNMITGVTLRADNRVGAAPGDMFDISSPGGMAFDPMGNNINNFTGVARSSWSGGATGTPYGIVPGDSNISFSPAGFPAVGGVAPLGTFTINASGNEGWPNVASGSSFGTRTK